MRKALTVCMLLFCLCAFLAAVNTAGDRGVPAPPDMAPSSAVLAAPPIPASDALAVSQEIGSPTPSADVSAEGPQTADLTETLDKIFTESGGFSGSVLVAQAGNIILEKSYGMSDREKGIQNTPDTKFLIGSVTKQFTAAAVLQLYEKGALDLHDTLSTYIPGFTRGDDITLWNLLTQTSGIKDYLNDAPVLISTVPFDKLSESRLIGLLKTEPLKFDPGTKYSYSNSNYMLLGYIVEQVSGMRYGDYLAQYIFDPLGMKNTGVFDVEHPPDTMASSYLDDATPVSYDTQNDESGYTRSAAGIYGAGCLYSTVGDLYIWDKALAADKIVSKSSLDQMFNPSVPVPGAVPACAYGFGWVIENDPGVGTVIRHTGILSGFRAYNGIFADRGFTVIILSNIKEYDGREKLIPDIKQALQQA